MKFKSYNKIYHSYHGKPRWKKRLILVLVVLAVLGLLVWLLLTQSWSPLYLHRA